MTEIKIYVWNCDVCKKLIKSFYPKEFRANIRFHKEIHKHNKKQEAQTP